jgi:PKD repeat protein
VQDNYLVESVNVDIQSPGGQPVGNFSMQFDSGTGSYYYEASYSDLGTYSFVICAKDSSGNWGSSSDVFEIMDTTNPIANAGPDQDVGVGETVVFDGSLSNDNFAMDTYEWTFNDGTGTVNLNGASPQHPFLTPGDYLVTLTVTDTSGNSGQDTMYVRVSGEKTPSVPTNLLVSEIGDYYIVLTWNAPTTNTDGSDLTNLDGYNIYRSSQSGGPYVKIATLILVSQTYRDDVLVPGFSGYYVVTALNGIGRESGHSNEAWAEIPERGSISGSVKDEDGEPIAGATIELKQNGVRVLAIQANSNGDFTMIDLDDGTYEIEIGKSGYTTSTIPLVISEGSSVALGSIFLDRDLSPPTEDSSLWVVLIVAVVVLLVAGMTIFLMIRRRKGVKKKEEGEEQEE